MVNIREAFVRIDQAACGRTRIECHRSPSENGRIEDATLGEAPCQGWHPRGTEAFFQRPRKIMGNAVGRKREAAMPFHHDRIAGAKEL